MVRPPAMTTSAVGQLRDCLAILVRDRCCIHSTLWRWPMFFRFSVAALAALCLSAPALTQQAIAQQPTVHDKSQDARIDELAKQLAALTTRLGTTENKVADIDRRIESLTTNVEKLTQVTADVDSRLKSLSDKVNELSDKPSTELTAMKTQLDAISVKDGDTYVPNISAAMTGSNKFRQ